VRKKHWTDLAINLKQADIKLLNYIKHHASKSNGRVHIDIDEFLELYGYSIRVSYFNARKSLLQQGVIWADKEMTQKNIYFYNKKIVG